MVLQFIKGITACILLLSLNNAIAQISPVRRAIFPEKLHESSGIVFTEHGLWTFNDGKTNAIYRVDTSTGIILQEINIANVSFQDAEAITCDKDFIYIEDGGNNAGHRKDLKVVRIRLSDIDTSIKIQTLQGDIIQFSYAEQTGFNEDKKDNCFDCEAMTAFDDSLFLFTKRRCDNTTKVYHLSKKPGNYVLQPSGSFDAQGLITDAAISPSGKYLLLLGYQKGHYASFMWVFSKFKGTDFFKGKSSKILLNSKNTTWQTEGITFLDDASIFLTCESTQDNPAALYKFQDIK
jgi:hypothetical protein